jgi:hypothetical protein
MLTYIKVCVRVNNVTVVKNVIVIIPCNNEVSSPDEDLCNITIF